MDHRFPIDGSPDPEARQQIEKCLAGMNIDQSAVSSWTEEDGRSLIGPYAALSYSPSVVQPFFAVGKTLYNPAVCKPRNRELAILALSSLVRIPLIVLEHRLLCGQLGITDEQYEEGLAGKVPAGLSEEEEMVYRLARELVMLDRPLDSTTWKQATEKMAKAELVGVVHVVGGYRWITLLAQVNG